MSDDIKSAMENIGTQIVLAVGWDDAQMAYKEFFGEIEASKFMRGGTGDGFVIVGEDMVNIKTFAPKKLDGNGFRDAIIQYSLKHYYTSSAQDFTIPERATPSRKISYDEI